MASFSSSCFLSSPTSRSRDVTFASDAFSDFCRVASLSRFSLTAWRISAISAFSSSRCAVAALPSWATAIEVRIALSSLTRSLLEALLDLVERPLHFGRRGAGGAEPLLGARLLLGEGLVLGLDLFEVLLPHAAREEERGEDGGGNRGAREGLRHVISSVRVVFSIVHPARPRAGRGTQGAQVRAGTLVPSLDALFTFTP